MIVAAIQARTGSSRLPGKVLADLAGKPVLARVVERVRRARSPDAIVVTTSVAAGDDAVAALCERIDVPCFRGSESDVLDRMYRAVAGLAPDAVVRITADCPLLDPDVLDAVVDLYTRTGADYASNINPPTFPHGLDVEICRFEVIGLVRARTRHPPDREHVTLHVRQRPDEFKLVNLTHDPDLSDLRWVLDLPGDLEFLKGVYARLGEGRFAMNDVLALLDGAPELDAACRARRELTLPGREAGSGTR
jgi:spore coat polysaccharide biosynthesis protein SpsF (cytidylyltransferase family)